MKQFLNITFHHPGKRYPRPVGNDFSHVFRIYFLLEHLIVFLNIFEFFLLVLKFLIQRHQFTVTDFRSLFEIAIPLGVGLLRLQGFYPAFNILNLFDDIFFTRPVYFHLVHFFLKVGNFLFNLVTPLFSGLIRLFLQRLKLYLQLNDSAVDGVNL